jgi:hypothetical protein
MTQEEEDNRASADPNTTATGSGWKMVLSFCLSFVISLVLIGSLVPNIDRFPVSARVAKARTEMHLCSQVFAEYQQRNATLPLPQPPDFGFPIDRFQDSVSKEWVVDPFVNWKDLDPYLRKKIILTAIPIVFLLINLYLWALGRHRSHTAVRSMLSFGLGFVYAVLCTTAILLFTDPALPKNPSYSPENSVRYWSDGHTKWLLLSVGPDGQQDVDLQTWTGPPPQHLEYDATNGSFSSGDIFRYSDGDREQLSGPR